MAWRKPTNVREWLAIVVRHRKKAFFSALVGGIAVGIASFAVPREYRAEAKFQRKLDLVVEEAGNPTLMKNVESTRHMIAEHLMGQSALERLVNDLVAADAYMAQRWQFAHGPDGELTQEGQFAQQDLIKRLQSSIRINHAVRSSSGDLIVVSYTDPDRAVAPKVANQLVENYIKRSREELNSMLVNAQRFFKGEVERYSTLVEDLETKKLRFELDHPGLGPGDPHSLKNRLYQLHAKRDTLAEEVHVKKHKRHALIKFYEGLPDEVVKEETVENPELEQLKAQYAQYAQALEHSLYTLQRLPAHPEVQRMQKRMASLKRRIQIIQAQPDMKREAERVPNVAKLDAAQKVQELNAELVALEKQLQEYNAMIEKFEMLERNFFPVRNEYIKIVTALTDAHEQLKDWRKHLKKVTVALTQELGYSGVHLRIVQHAPELARPSRPTMLMVGAASLILGLAFSAMVIGLSELFDRSFHTIEQAVDELKLPVLGAVNEIVTPGRAMRRQVMRFGVFPAMALCMVVVLGATMLSVYVSLQYPHRFAQFKSNPINFVENHLLTG